MVPEIVLDASVWEGYQADSGKLSVPENRSQEGTRWIQLPVVRVHAQRQPPLEPVFLYAGGPGLSNIQPQQLPVWLLKEHDVVMVGYRGVDGSISLNVPQFSALVKAIPDPLSHDSLRAIGEALTSASQWLQEQGTDVPSYSVLDVVDDMEDAREALGYDQVNLIGGSYGGAVAYTHCIRYPGSIHRCILTEASFPFNVGVTEPQDVDRRLQRLNALWKQSDRVRDSGDIVETIRNVLGTLPQQWKSITIDPGRVKLMTFLGLYRRETLAQSLDAFVAAERGDYSGLAFMTALWSHVADWFNLGEMYAKLYATRMGPDRDYELEMEPPGSIIGSPLSKLGWAPWPYANWPVKPLPLKHRIPQHTDIETLLVYGSPESVPEGYLHYFSRGSLVTLKDVAHMEVATEQAEASAHLQSRFLSAGEVDDSLFQETSPPPMTFTPQQSYQEQAKGLLETH